MSSDGYLFNIPLLAQQQYRMFHDIYILLDSSDRQILSAFNLTTSQYTTLLLLDVSNGQRLGYLSDRLLVDKSTVTRIIDQLEREGLVQRVADPTDRRAQRVLLTSAGLERRTKAYAAHTESLERRLNSLTPVEQTLLRDLLVKLRAGLRAYLGIPDV